MNAKVSPRLIRIAGATRRLIRSRKAGCEAISSPSSMLARRSACSNLGIGCLSRRLNRTAVFPPPVPTYRPGRRSGNNGMPRLWANLSAAVGRAVWLQHGSAQGMTGALFSAAFAASFGYLLWQIARCRCRADAALTLLLNRRHFASTGLSRATPLATGVRNPVPAQRIGADHLLGDRMSTTIFQMSCARAFTAVAVAASPTSSKIAFLSKSSRKPYGSSFSCTA